MIQPVEELLDAVLSIVHPKMWRANRDTTQQLLCQLDVDLPIWPIVYPVMDVIANRVTPRHCNGGGAFSFYDHLVSLGVDHDAILQLHDFQAELAYPPGTSTLFIGKVLAHEVPKWSQGERLVMAHYAKDDVQDRLKVARPLLPSQMVWLGTHS